MSEPENSADQSPAGPDATPGDVPPLPFPAGRGMQWENYSERFPHEQVTATAAARASFHAAFLTNTVSHAALASK